MATVDLTKPFVPDSDTIGKKIKPVSMPDPVLDIDTSKRIIDEIVSAGSSSKLDITSLDSFTHISQNRETVY